MGGGGAVIITIEFKEARNYNAVHTHAPPPLNNVPVAAAFTGQHWKGVGHPALPGPFAYKSNGWVKSLLDCH